MKERIQSILILVLAIVAIAGLFWAVKFFVGGEVEPSVICNPPKVPVSEQKCFWTGDIHLHISVFDKAGKEVAIGFEIGNEERNHTHSEKNLIHWHGLLPADPATKEVTDWSDLAIRHVPEDLKLGLEGLPKFIVNGKEADPSYIWKDGDHVEIHYGSR